MASECRQKSLVRECAFVGFIGSVLTRSTSSSHLFLLASARRSFCNRVGFGARAGSSTTSSSSEPVLDARRRTDAWNVGGGIDGVQGSSKAAPPARTCQYLGSTLLVIIAISRQGHQIGRKLDSHATRHCSCGTCPLFHIMHGPSRGIGATAGSPDDLYIRRRLF